MEAQGDDFHHWLYITGDSPGQQARILGDRLLNYKTDRNYNLVSCHLCCIGFFIIKGLENNLDWV